MLSNNDAMMCSGRFFKSLSLGRSSLVEEARPYDLSSSPLQHFFLFHPPFIVLVLLIPECTKYGFSSSKQYFVLHNQMIMESASILTILTQLAFFDSESNPTVMFIVVNTHGNIIHCVETFIFWTRACNLIHLQMFHENFTVVNGRNLTIYI